MKLYPIIVLCFVVIGCAQTQDTLSIGVVAPLSGPVAKFGEDMRSGFDLALSEINAQGGIDGRTVRLVYEDANCLSQGTLLSALTKLKDIDQVIAVLGPFCGTDNIVAGQFAEQNKLFIISPGDNFGPNSSYKVNTRYLIYKEAELLAQYALEQGWKKVGILYFNNEWGQAYKNKIEGYLREHGGELVIAESYDFSSVDVRTPLLKIKDTAPDAVVILDAHRGEIFTQVREIGLSMPLLSEWEIESAIDTVISSGALNGVVYASPVTERTSFHQKYFEHYAKEPNVISIDSYDASKILGEALRKCTPQHASACLINYVTSLKNYSGGGGAMNFNTTLWAFEKPFVYKQVVDGKFEQLKMPSKGSIS